MKVTKKLNLLLEDDKTKTDAEFISDKAKNSFGSLSNLTKKLDSKKDSKAISELSSLSNPLKKIATFAISDGALSDSTKKKIAKEYKVVKNDFLYTLKNIDLLNHVGSERDTFAKDLKALNDLLKDKGII